MRHNRTRAKKQGWLKTTILRLLVGPSTTERWTHPSGEQWRSRVVIERCRFLEGAACKGMCVGLCQQPTERFFGEELGLPLSMEPNFADGSCTMTWGQRPRADALAEQELGCFRECALRSTAAADQRRDSDAPCELVSQHAAITPDGAGVPARGPME